MNVSFDGIAIGGNYCILRKPNQWGQRQKNDKDLFHGVFV
jgi:hypothetical protein